MNVTKISYEDPVVVEGYTKEHILNPDLDIYAKDFAANMQNKRLIDIGCGPGQYSYLFAEANLIVTGIDYSSEMIRTAKALLPQASKLPTFMIADMKELNKLFTPDSFDGVWMCASLLHINLNETRNVLEQVFNITTNKGKVFIGWVGYKGAKEGTKLQKDDLYKPNTLREFTIWKKDSFNNLVKKVGFKVLDIPENKNWFHFLLEVNK